MKTIMTIMIKSKEILKGNNEVKLRSSATLCKISLLAFRLMSNIQIEF